MSELYIPPELQDLGDGDASTTGVAVPIAYVVWDVVGAINYGAFVNVATWVNVDGGDEE